MKKYNNTRSKNRKAQYNPRRIHTLGNHCGGRYDTFLHKNPEFVDAIGVKDLKYHEYWDTNAPYLSIVEFSGVSFCHLFYVKNQRFPLPNPKAVLAANHRPSIWGHTHVWQNDLTYDVKGNRLEALNIGCYLDPDDRGDTFNYTGGHGSLRWWSGLTVLHDVNDRGEFDYERISIDRVRRLYG